MDGYDKRIRTARTVRDTSPTCLDDILDRDEDELNQFFAQFDPYYGSEGYEAGGSGTDTGGAGGFEGGLTSRSARGLGGVSGGSGSVGATGGAGGFEGGLTSRSARGLGGVSGGSGSVGATGGATGGAGGFEGGLTSRSARGVSGGSGSVGTGTGTGGGGHSTRSKYSERARIASRDQRFGNFLSIDTTDDLPSESEIVDIVHSGGSTGKDLEILVYRKSYQFYDQLKEVDHQTLKSDSIIKIPSGKIDEPFMDLFIHNGDTAPIIPIEIKQTKSAIGEEVVIPMKKDAQELMKSGQFNCYIIAVNKNTFDYWIFKCNTDFVDTGRMTRNGDRPLIRMTEDPILYGRFR